jgi:hypothetical protein
VTVETCFETWLCSGNLESSVSKQLYLMIGSLHALRLYTSTQISHDDLQQTNQQPVCLSSYFCSASTQLQSFKASRIATLSPPILGVSVCPHSGCSGNEASCTGCVKNLKRPTNHDASTSVGKSFGRSQALCRKIRECSEERH